MGAGESWTDGATAASTISFIENDLKPSLLGLDPRLPEKHFKTAIDRAAVSARRSQTWAAMSAIDIALWDIKGQALGEPLWRMLGGHEPRVMPYASAGLYKDGQTTDQFADEVRRLCPPRLQGGEDQGRRRAACRWMWSGWRSCGRRWDPMLG